MGDNKRSPAAIEQANIFSYITFHWIQPMLLYGRKNTLVADDMQDLSKKDKIQRISDLVLQEWTREVQEKKQASLKKNNNKMKRPNLLKVLWRCFGLYACVPFVSALVESVCKVVETVLLGYVIRFFNTPDMTVGEGMSYAIGLFLVTLFRGTVHHHNFFHILRIGTWTRQGLIALMYRKCLTLSTSSAISTGTVVNLISNDLQPFENCAPFFMYSVLGPLEMIAVMYLLWRELGVACLAGLLAFAILMPIQVLFGRRFGKIRSKTVHARDDRIRTLSDVFSGIALVKLCAWEVPFQERIMALRSIELKYIWKSNVMQAANLSIYFFFQPLIALCAFVAYWLQGKTLTADKVFVSLTLFNIVRQTMTSFFPKALASMAEVRVSAKRITDFLLLPELRSIENEIESTTFAPKEEKQGQWPQTPEILVEMKNASFSWAIETEDRNMILELSAKEKQSKEAGAENKIMNIETKDLIDPTLDGINHDRSDGANALGSFKKAILNDITMTLRHDELLAIVGPVGCGKSSFCMAILREMTLTSGSMSPAQLCGSDNQQRPITMSYSAQSPWIFAGSIRSNILFGSKFDQERYSKVIKACELTRDLSLFPQGDATIIGEKGVTLSGGQRARVSLARAAYRDSDLYVLDDPLSAVDSKVGRALFDNCINGFLKGKARVLVTHQLQYIKDCETVMVLERGQITHMGPVDEIMGEEVKIKQQVDGTSAKSIQLRTRFINVLREFANKTSVAPEEDEMSTNDAKLIQDKTPGNVNIISNEIETEGEAKNHGDNDDGASIMEKNLTVEEVATGETSPKAYLEFFRIGSTWSKLMLTVICLTSAQAIMVGSEFFLTVWSSATAAEQARSYYPTAFGLYCLGTVIMTLIRSHLFFDCVVSSARNMFRAMLDALLRTGIDFFHANPHGRVLNRFSKDMALCDELLPVVFFEAIQTGFMLLGSVVTVCIVNPWVILAIPFILAGFAGLRWLYMKSSRQVKRIDSQSRSPIYSHLSETLHGLSTIRIFGVSGDFMKEHIKTQEDNGRAFFTYLAMARWLGYRLDAVSALFLGVTAIACVAVRDTQEASRAGLAMSSVISLSGELQWAIRMSVEVAILMVSVERMMEYAHLQPEATKRHEFNLDHTPIVPNSWPSEAQVTFEDVSLTYPRGDKPVLKHISLDFRPGERVGIVGRTGAGKSSLVSALFRLVETTTGDPPRRGGISIDGIDISKIGVHDLREKMAIIPQEPFLFRGTLRFNLDPLSQYQDADIWAALEAAELKQMAQCLEGGLNAVVDDNGKNFSVGERQLLSLARAILRRSKIIVMDEATANVDLQSDRMIQKAISSQFKGATIFTIAHRLNTVIGDYDRILVLDQGEVVEFGEPWELLKDDAHNGMTSNNKGRGWLKGMVEGTGPENEAKLKQAAKEHWEKHNNSIHH
ncbi:P-loop containing nucleoside triphosphate hydrolase protein [Lobosporangium transversale]|uniref:p-loop containing nucleoside triphosphate hydrolase protein n=1 Tax=Lobosporangium transversale TaxID=64571 RepID=A0A1Y2GER4_9FUNG|nr:P-loop containing nucleoside triphosphate hydrolase protein [Lobosporangium transversale]ORZ08815.1 P-loop containing nucleoside triphosphate hydrolase protein [Lobosporangium transversale]|eukprot:XP_021878598.1 P-loop containing nucleoside triphosphate hydrolase protein [Lobosporangium transversale]